MERIEDYMAKHFSEVKRELEQPDGHMAGAAASVSQSFRPVSASNLSSPRKRGMPEMPDEGLRTRTTRPTSSEP